MKLSSSCEIFVLSWSLLSDGSLVKEEYVGVTYEMGEEGEEGSILNWNEWVEREVGKR